MSQPHSDLIQVSDQLFARAPENDIEPSLDRIAFLTDLLGHPQRSAPVIQVTGTNGKTSTARMIDVLVRSLGLRCGLYTSPHLHAVTERIQIDGSPMDPEEFVELYRQTRPLLELADQNSEAEGGPPLTFFEAITAMALAAFADAPVDVIVLEVGLGGTWDATTVADAAVAVVTPIARDHENWLGDTPEQIAVEKAGIIKEGAVAVLAQQEPAVAEVLLRRCEQVGATVAREGVEFAVLQRALAVGGQQATLKGLHATYPDVFLPLFGAHQAHNAVLALAAVDALLSSRQSVDADVVAEGFAEIVVPGRLQVLQRAPVVLADAAHNPSGMAAAIAAVELDFTFDHVVALVSVMADKDVAAILAELQPHVAHVVITQNSSARALSLEALQRVAVDVFGSDRVSSAEQPQEALESALAIADRIGPEGGAAVLVTGSVVTVADVVGLIGRGSDSSQAAAVDDDGREDNEPADTELDDHDPGDDEQIDDEQGWEDL